MTQSLPSLTISTATAAPDWTAQSEEIHCPLCDYNLRGLTEPRCPECGHQFEWVKLLDIRQATHPYLFEHHPEKNVRSFLSTAIHGLVPWQFWKTLRPEMRSSQSRLIGYWILASLGAVMVMASIVMARAMWLAMELAIVRPMWLAGMNSNPAGAQWYIKQYGSIQNAIQEFYPPVLSAAFVRRFNDNFEIELRLVLFVCALAIVAWPWLTTATLMIYRQSVRSAKLKPIHLLRCAIYCYDMVFWLGLIVLIGTIGLAYWDRNRSPEVVWMDVVQFVGMAIPIGAVLMSARLIVAHRLYLRLRHSVIDVLASQLIVYLLVLILLLNLRWTGNWMMWFFHTMWRF